MSLNWEWSDKMGEAIYETGETQNIYRGNAHMIAVYEYEAEGQKMYQLTWFAADREHLKNMLGLKKGYDNVIKNRGIKKLRLNTEYPETRTIVSDFAKAKMKIEIELY